jgi:Uma2 family endonuclease
VPELDFELVTSDGVPLDSNWERLQIHLLTDVVKTAMDARGRRDFFVGGDMFIYYDPAQAQGIASNPLTHKYYKGPDFFFVSGVEPGNRESWVVWEEGRFPEIIAEFISPTSQHKDRVKNKPLYEQTFRTPEYFHYDRAIGELEGFRLDPRRYRPIMANAEGRMWSQQLQAFLGLWEGSWAKVPETWVRLFDQEGRLMPTAEEAARQRAEQERQRAEQDRQRAEQERQRAEQEQRLKEQERQRAEQADQRAAAAEAELARLRAQLADRPS